MNNHRGILARLGLVLLLVLTGLLGGCGGSDSDETAPTLTFAGTDPVTTVRSHMLAGTVEPGAKLEVTVDTAAEVSSLQSANGLWSCTIDGLQPGNNIVTVKATDSDGNLNLIKLNLLYDALTIERWVSPLPGDTLTIGGLVDPAAASGGLGVTVDTAGNFIPTVADDHWTAVLTDLTTGDNVVTVTFAPPGLAEVEKTLTVKVNASAPVLTIDQVASPTTVGSQIVGGSRSSDLNVAIIAVTASVENLDLTTDSQAWSVTLKDLDQGKNPFTAATSANGVTVTAHDLIVHDAVPTVTETVPAADAHAASSTLVQAGFSEPMDEATIDDASFTVACQAVPVAGAVKYDAGTRTATFTPTVFLPAGVCTAALSGAVADLTGNVLIPFSWDFIVD